MIKLRKLVMLITINAMRHDHPGVNQLVRIASKIGKYTKTESYSYSSLT